MTAGTIPSGEKVEGKTNGHVFRKVMKMIRAVAWTEREHLESKLENLKDEDAKFELFEEYLRAGVSEVKFLEEFHHSRGVTPDAGAIGYSVASQVAGDIHNAALWNYIDETARWLVVHYREVSFISMAEMKHILNPSRPLKKPRTQADRVFMELFQVLIASCDCKQMILRFYVEKGNKEQLVFDRNLTNDDVHYIGHKLENGQQISLQEWKEKFLSSQLMGRAEANYISCGDAARKLFEWLNTDPECPFRKMSGTLLRGLDDFFMHCTLASRIYATALMNLPFATVNSCGFERGPGQCLKLGQMDHYFDPFRTEMQNMGEDMFASLDVNYLMSCNLDEIDVWQQLKRSVVGKFLRKAASIHEKSHEDLKRNLAMRPEDVSSAEWQRFTTGQYVFSVREALEEQGVNYDAFMAGAVDPAVAAEALRLAKLKLTGKEDESSGKSSKGKRAPSASKSVPVAAPGGRKLTQAERKQRKKLNAKRLPRPDAQSAPTDKQGSATGGSVVKAQKESAPEGAVKAEHQAAFQDHDALVEKEEREAKGKEPAKPTMSEKRNKRMAEETGEELFKRGEVEKQKCKRRKREVPPVDCSIFSAEQIESLKRIFNINKGIVKWREFQSIIKTIPDGYIDFSGGSKLTVKRRLAGCITPITMRVDRPHPDETLTISIKQYCRKSLNTLFGISREMVAEL
eukprot:Nk52_evm10s24 gene=Nk52_evmTU10s24